MSHALWRATAMGYASVVAGLLERPGVDVNQVGDKGHTTLLQVNGHSEIVSMLLAKEGVDVNQARMLVPHHFILRSKWPL